MEIRVSLEVYKALTAALSYEGQTYDDVLRALLSLDSPLESESNSSFLEGVETLSEGLARGLDPKAFHSRGLRLPEGTKLRARYKGVPYIAEIKGGHWIDMAGQSQPSPSAAASSITGNNVNGLKFWEAQLPGEVLWRRLESLVRR
ncbi:DUF4357 domain-containing protein [Sphingomonas canadensis]|uniref:DUF4357 domain-containing protein n=1 Tax=Sphingomonas canadensis TaxID=1219257 RepID=A0ABW3HAF5_9SPHN|nr:DUF4357 domain-containing protein [Sphingomonas canadensis]MCW3836578.1 DUF4357 domain-containing protein [Sphingomonas canadensis]